MVPDDGSHYKEYAVLSKKVVTQDDRGGITDPSRSGRERDGVTNLQGP